MSDDHKKAFLRYANLLSVDPHSLPKRDIREHLLSLRGGPVGISYTSEILATKFGANFPRLFTRLVPSDSADFPQVDHALIHGTVYRTLEPSNKASTAALASLGSHADIILFESAFLASTHSWSHANREREPKYACLSYVFDDIAHYFMADYPNRLIQKLNGTDEISADERVRARALIDRIVRERVSKYNAQPMTAPDPDPTWSRRVLVCDQSYADASTVYGLMDDADFERMLFAAISENPDAEIWVKSHPDTTWEKKSRAGYFSHLSSCARVRILREPMNPYMVFDLVDTVYVGTSQMGFEALLAGKRVVTFGAPFYGGWGVTDDRRVIPHRDRARDLESLFHYFYVWYTIYVVPDRDGPAEIEDVLDYIVNNRPHTPPLLEVARASAPKVSVVVPVYDVERYVERALRSVMTQSLAELEIIVVNDGSPDGSQAIIERLAGEDPRIRPVILKENVGLGFARNKGVERARGEYLWFLDSDDWLSHPDVLRELVAYADSYGSQMTRGKKTAEAVFDSDDRHVRDRQDVTERLFDRDIARTTFADECVILHNRHCWVWLYRTEFLRTQNIRFTNRKWEERAFLTEALLKAERISLTTVRATTYRIRKSSISRGRKSLTDVEAFLINIERTCELYREHGAAERCSPLRYHLDFQITQFLHFLFFGFWYGTLKEKAPDAVDAYLSRVRAMLDGCDFRSDDVCHDPIALSAAHIEAGAYGLIAAALRSGRRDLLDAAIASEPIVQDALHRMFLAAPESAEDEDLERALNQYAKNGRVAASPSAAIGQKTGTPPRIVIHIGSTKTGSTSLQNLMSENRPALLRQGIWYPEVGLFWQRTRPHKQAGHADFARAAVRGDLDLRQYLEAGLSRMPHVHTVVLSSEAFFLNARSHAMANYFEGFPVEVVVYLRRQDEWANSQYAEFVAGGAVKRVSKDFEQWLAEPKTRAWMDYAGLIKRWRTVLPADRITARLYGKGDAVSVTDGPDWDIVDDFASVTGLTQLRELAPLAQRLRNSDRLSTPHVVLLRQYNTRGFPSHDAYLSFVEDATAALRTWRRDREMPMPAPWFLTEALSERIIRDALDGNAWLAREVFGCDPCAMFPHRAEPPAPTGLLADEIALVERAYDRFRTPKARAAHAAHSASPARKVAAGAPARKLPAGKRLERSVKRILFAAGLRKKPVH